MSAICSNMEIIIINEVSQTEENKYQMIALTCRIQNMKQMNFYLQNRNRLTEIENKLMVTKGEMGWGRDKLGVWD